MHQRATRHPRDVVSNRNHLRHSCLRYVGRDFLHQRKEQSVELGARGGAGVSYFELGGNGSKSSPRLTLLLAVMVVVASLAGGDGGGGLQWNALIKSGGKCGCSNFQNLVGVSMGRVGSG